MLRELVYEKKDGAYRTKKFSVKSKSEFHPFPRYEERDFWNNCDREIAQCILDDAEPYADFRYPMLPASEYREYYKSGDRDGFEKLYDERRKVLASCVMAECVEGKGRFIESIINGIWCICEESTWVLPAHNFIYEPEMINGERTLPDPDLPTLDIFSSDTAMLLSTAYYLLKNRLDEEEPIVCRRMLRELKRRVIDPFLTRYDYWWMGYSERRDLNNWAPWCIMNCVTAVLFCEEEDDLRKWACVRAMDMLDIYLKGIPEDGGCDEGATYWGRSCGMLLEGFEMLYEATDKQLDPYGFTKLRNFANYIRRMYIGNGYVVNFADGSAKTVPAAELLFTAGKRMNDKGLETFGANCFVDQISHHNFSEKDLVRAMLTLTNAADMRASAASSSPVEKSWYFPSIEVLVSREKAAAGEGLFLCAKAGGNGDSHNHNDVGNFVVYQNGMPGLVDVGVEVYRRYFFSADRYKIWTMQSQYHNLPTINGCMQEAGKEYRAENVRYECTEQADSIQMELQKAYPPEAGIEKYCRRLTLDRESEKVILQDQWELNTCESLTMHFMTPAHPELSDGRIFIPCGRKRLVLKYDEKTWKPTLETRSLTDRKLTASWGSEMNRISFACIALAEEGSCIFEIYPEQTESDEYLQ